MRFVETKLRGAFIIELEPIEDERGFFARSFCRREFEDHGLNPNVVQCNISYNRRRGTLRGMHYQAAPHEEAKLIRCTKGAIYDVIVDLRANSPTSRQWVAVELTSQNGTMIHVPEGFAHGLQTLQDDSEVFYLMSEFYAPECQRGFRWNDPTFGIHWPIAQPIVSEKDRLYQNFQS